MRIIFFYFTYICICKIIVEWAALYLKYSGFLPVLSDAPQFVIIFSLGNLIQMISVPALRLFKFCLYLVEQHQKKSVLFCQSKKLFHFSN